VSLPGEEDRTRVFERRAGSLPPEIELIPEPDGYTMTDDLLMGEVVLPTGRIVVGEYLLEVDQLDVAVLPGRARSSSSRSRRTTGWRAPTPSA
jgi:hypothetical protein